MGADLHYNPPQGPLRGEGTQELIRLKVKRIKKLEKENEKLRATVKHLKEESKAEVKRLKEQLKEE